MNYKYDNRIVAFIDILGFAGKISKSKTDTASLNTLCETVHSIQDYLKEAQDDFDLPETSNITQFSDSIVISLKMEDSYKMLAIFQLIKKIQVNLIGNNILLRGGIVKGELIHTNDLLLGPGLVNAYNLESKCAQYPRIVIDPKVLWQFARIGGVKKQLRLKDYDYHKTFASDNDGTSYIDYFNDVDNYLNNGDSFYYFQNLCEMIKGGIDSDDISIRIKYLWMREKLKNSEYFGRYKTEYRRIVTNRNKAKK
jgi:hypothetical protein